MKAIVLDELIGGSMRRNQTKVGLKVEKGFGESETARGRNQTKVGLKEQEG